ncbi:MAG: helix-turn-helix transcriptional regulator [Gemmatimonadaceae bacterium]|nr:helix-turn-helix transcriptional regulator [Gemmatimonadaceae bacterium]
MTSDYQLLEALRLGIRVVSRRGEVLYENARLRQLLREDDDPEMLESAVRALNASVMSAAAELPVITEGGVQQDTTVATATGRYFISVAAAGAGEPADDWVLVVSVERVVTALPSTAELRARFGLTQREAEVALLLAHGSDNGTIAQSLGVSGHTARHHTERILAKLGIRTRSGVMAAIVRGGRIPHHLPNARPEQAEAEPEPVEEKRKAV